MLTLGKANTRPLADLDADAAAVAGEDDCDCRVRRRGHPAAHWHRRRRVVREEAAQGEAGGDSAAQDRDGYSLGRRRTNIDASGSHVGWLW